MENLKIFLESQYGKIPKKDWDQAVKYLEVEKRNRGEEILSVGEICDSIYFIRKGAVKSVEMVNNKEKVIHFFLENSFFTQYESLLGSTPSAIAYKCVEATHYMKVKYSNLELLYEKSHYFANLARKRMQEQFLREMSLRKSLLKYEAKERYENLYRSNPEIFERFALKDIASFIGITPVSLSRLRKDYL